MRLIDADALFKQIQHAEIEAPDLVCKAWVMADVASMIHNSPTIDAEPVRHGRWIYCENHNEIVQCSECGIIRNIYKQEGWNYCPNCGVKMDAEVEYDE